MYCSFWGCENGRVVVFIMFYIKCGEGKLGRGGGVLGRVNICIYIWFMFENFKWDMVLFKKVF